MHKFAVFSGFLGSGKTTLMMALTRYFEENHGKSAMISNDLGGPGLADHRLAKLSGCSASELTGTCICYQTENLVQRLRSLYENGCQLVVSDIPGFGVGALEHVYHKLDRQFPGQFPLAPFTVLCDPRSVASAREGRDPDLDYILRSQLLEADLIVLNKIDLLDSDEKAEMISYLKEHFPQARVLPVSALTGQGLEALSQALIHHCASLRAPDLSYGGPRFLSAMGKISEYNIQYYAVVCCDSFDGTAYLRDLAQEIQALVAQVPGDIPHMKFLAWQPEGDYGKVDLLGIHQPLVTTKAFSGPCTELAVVLNASAFCPPDALDALAGQALETVSGNYNLTLTVYKKECFSAMGGSR